MEQDRQEKEPRGLFSGIAAFFGAIAGPKGFFGPGFWTDFKEGWDNAKGSAIEKNSDDGNPWLRTSWLDKNGDDEYPVLSYYDDRIRTDRVNPDVTHFLWSRGEFDCDKDDRLI